MCIWGGNSERKSSDSLSGMLLTSGRISDKCKDLGVISREYYNNKDPGRREKMVSMSRDITQLCVCFSFSGWSPNLIQCIGAESTVYTSLSLLPSSSSSSSGLRREKQKRDSATPSNTVVSPISYYKIYPRPPGHLLSQL